MPEQGLLVIFSGPSGSGKGTVLQSLLTGRTDLVVSVSATTRVPRPGEQEGVNYFFRTRQEFEQMIAQDQLLEYAEYSGNYYGTPASFIRSQREQGRHVLLEIEVQGALQVMRRCPDAVSIFLVPPSLGELERRLRGRGTETEEAISLRMEAARREIACMDHYQYVVVNREVAAAAADVSSILRAETMRFSRMKDIKEEFAVC